MIKRLEINTEKIKKETKVLLLSDLHKSKKMKDDQIPNMEKSLENEMDDIDYIIISGDLINTPKDLTDSDFIKELINMLKKLTKAKPTYICFGNHDITISKDDQLYFRTILSKLDNIHCLTNGEKITINDISILGFCPNLKYYKDHLGSSDEFLRQYISQHKDSFTKENYNILVTHDPTSIIELSKEKKECIEPNTDLVISGHMHNGLMPNILKKITFHRGIIGPYKTPFPKYAHGELKINNTDFIILGAVNAYMDNTLINKAYSPEATILTLKK